MTDNIHKFPSSIDNDPEVIKALAQFNEVIQTGGIDGLAIAITHKDGGYTRITSDAMGNLAAMVGTLEIMKSELMPEPIVPPFSERDR